MGTADRTPRDDVAQFQGDESMKCRSAREYPQAVALAVALALASAAGSPLAMAQTAPADEGLQEVLVTGSRIAKSGYTTPTPVTVLSAEVLEQTNSTNIGAAVSQLPAFRASNTPTTNGFGSFNVGAQIVNLRGLGVNRNLVLVDGRRFAPVTREGTVDLNLIPSGLVERTDVVTGGASAAYGSDAIAGAVNVILNKRLTGIKGQVDFGKSQQGDGTDRHVSLAGGDDFANGRGHFIVGGEFEKQEGIGDCFTRNWCKGGQVITNSGVGQVAYQPANIRTDVGGGFFANTNGVITSLNNNTATTAAIRNLFGTGPVTVRDGITFNSAGQPVDYTLGLPASGNTAASGDVVSPFTTTQLMVPVKRYTSYGHADYAFGENLNGFVEGSYGHVEGDVMQSRYFGAGITVFPDNPYIPAAVRAAIPGAPQPSATPSGTRPATGSFSLGVLGQRRGHSSSEADTWRITFGLDGKLSSRWKWDAYYQYAHTSRDQAVEDNLVTGASRVINRPGSGGVSNPGALAYWTWATDAVYNPADAALPAAQRRIVCRATLSSNAALAAAAAGCAPFNPFGAGNASPAALDYVYRTLTEGITISQHVVAANVSGDVADLWAGPLSVAAGLEYRRDATDLVHDALSNSFAYFQNFGADYNASQNVYEGYVEGELPLAKDLLVAKSLTLNAAARRTSYKISGFGGFNQAAASSDFDATTWKVGLVWEPSDWMRLRATRSRDIRAPNFNELFQASASNFTAVTNRFLPGNPSEFPVGLAGGNPLVRPETADTTTIGMVLQPQWGWSQRLRFSADYYDIKVNDYIAAPGGAQTIVDRCALNQDPLTCALIVFGPGNTLAEVRNVNVNLQWLRTRGLDLEADYRQPVGDAGDLSFRLLATRTFESSTNLFGVVTDRAGETGGAGIPHLLLNLYTTWASGPFSMTLAGRYIPQGKFNAQFKGPDDPTYQGWNTSTGAPIVNTINDNIVKKAYYFNLNSSYNLSQEGTRKVQVFGSINNLFNRSPPMAPSLQYPTNPVYFDQIGRYFRAGVRFSF
jgi:outer membrane receptor protein involved in Fe transport